MSKQEKKTQVGRGNGQAALRPTCAPKRVFQEQRNPKFIETP
jgi:hypothetical protein